MGLAIIIILLMLGLVFIVKFTLLKPKASIQEDFASEQISQNFLNSLLITNVQECNDATVSQLISDCYEHSGSYGIISCELNSDSCAYLRDSLKSDFFENTLNKWNIPYRFSIDFPNNPLDINYNTKECIIRNVPDTYSKMENAQAKIGTLSGTTITVNLDLCS